MLVRLLRTEGGFTFNPADDFNGSVSFTYTVTDPEGSSVDVVRTIRVVAVNDAPELAEGTTNPFGMDEDGTLPISRGELLSGFSDVESENSELMINNLAVSAGFISGNDSDGWTYTPADDFNGEVTISYAVTDPDGGTTLAAYSFNVESLTMLRTTSWNLPSSWPTSRRTQSSSSESQLLNSFDDPDGDTLSVTGLVVNTANAGTIDGDAANGYTFTANPNYNGPVELTYSVTDGTESTSATASFNVFSVNDAPELINGENYKSAIDITPFTTSAAPLTLGDYPRTYSIDQGVETNGPTLVLNDDGSVDAVFDLRQKHPLMENLPLLLNSEQHSPTCHSGRVAMIGLML